MEHCKRKVSYCDASYITHHVYVTHARVLSSWIIKLVSASMNLPAAPLPHGYADLLLDALSAVTLVHAHALSSRADRLLFSIVSEAMTEMRTMVSVMMRAGLSLLSVYLHSTVISFLNPIILP